MSLKKIPGEKLEWRLSQSFRDAIFDESIQLAELLRGHLRHRHAKSYIDAPILQRIGNFFINPRVHIDLDSVHQHGIYPAIQSHGNHPSKYSNANIELIIAGNRT